MSDGLANLVVRAADVPTGLPQAKDFAINAEPIPSPGEGEVLFRAIYMTLDPSMRRRMPSPPGVPQPLGGSVAIGDQLICGLAPPTRGRTGGFIGEVIESRHPDFSPGDFVQGGCYWQTYHVVHGDALDKLPADACLRKELALLGQHGFVAWCGIELIGDIKPGETLVVSAAGGAIGMVAGQLGKARGARVIGVASGEKATYVVDELGFDGCIDRNAEDVGAGLDRLCPDGIDVYFDNVGGAVQLAAFDRMRDFGRIIICGMASEYNAPEADFGPPLRPVLRKRLKIQGFVVYDHGDRLEDFHREMRALIEQGRMHYREEIVDGFAEAPAALARLLEGKNKGKMLIKLGVDPTDHS